MSLGPLDHRQQLRRQSDIDASRIRISWNVVAWILGVVVTGLVTYNATINSVRDMNNETIQRVLIVETKQGTTDYRLQRIESKLDQLLDRTQ